MEAAQIPLYELRKRYTKSELTLAGWRSAEISANMREQQVHAPTRRADLPETDKIILELEEKIGDLGDKMVDEKGAIDLRRLTGPEAVRFMNAIGCAARRRTWGGD